MNMSPLGYKKIVSWLAVAVWMFLIFYLSHQPASQSSDLSSGITDTIINTMQRLFPFIPLDADLFHNLIRKSAHFVAYLILGVLVMQAQHVPKRKAALFALIICILYGATDEVHQLFIPGRSGEIRDVAIDSAGAATGIGLYLLGVLIARRFTRKKQIENHPQ